MEWSSDSNAAGHVYVCIHGGIIRSEVAKEFIGFDDNERHAIKFNMNVKVEDEEKSISFWGASSREPVGMIDPQYSEITKGLNLENAWFCGGLPMIPIEEQESSDQATSHYVKYGKTLRIGNSNPRQEPKTKLTLYSKLKKHLWPGLLRKNGDNAEGSGLQQKNNTEMTTALFETQDLMLPVTDFYGCKQVMLQLRMPIKSSSRKKQFAEYFASIPLSACIHNTSKFGRTYSVELPDGQVREVRLGNLERIYMRNSKLSENGEVSPGFFIVEVIFVPKSTLNEPVFHLHNAVIQDNIRLVSFVLENLKRPSLVHVLTYRDPLLGNMNLVELAAWLSRNEILQCLISASKSSGVWNEWYRSSTLDGRNALHLAVLANNAVGVKMTANFFSKFELTYSIFESTSLDDIVETQRMRSPKRYDRTSIFRSIDVTGCTPLALACSLPNDSDGLQIVKTLYSKDDDFNVCNKNGESPLLLACKANQTKVVMFLLSIIEEAPPGFKTCKAKPNMPDATGMRALHVACMNGNNEIVAALLDAGAFSSLRTQDGTLPIHFAAIHGHLDVVKTLVEWPDKFSRSPQRNWPLDVTPSEVDQSTSSNGFHFPMIDSDPNDHALFEQYSHRRRDDRGSGCLSWMFHMRNLSGGGHREPSDAEFEFQLENEYLALLSMYDAQIEEAYRRNAVENSSQRAVEHSQNEFQNALEGMILRDPGLHMLQWGSLKDAKALALDNGHTEVYEYLLHNSKTEPQIPSHSRSSSEITDDASLPSFHDDDCE